MGWFLGYSQLFSIVLVIVFVCCTNELTTKKAPTVYVTPIPTTTVHEDSSTTSSRGAMSSSKPIGSGTTPAAYKYMSINPSKWIRVPNRKLKRRKRPKSISRKLEKDQKKYRYEKPLRGFRRKAHRPSIVDMMRLPAMKWLHRWFFDIYYNKHKFTDIVYSVMDPGKAYVTVCPLHKRLKFEVAAKLEFTIYLMQSPLDNGGADNQPDNLLGSVNVIIPEHTISVREKETRLVVLDYESAKIKQTEDITKIKAETDYAIFQHEDLGVKRYHSYWLWWEQNGFIYMGRDNDPPYLAHLVNFPTSNNKPVINIKTIAFGVSHTGSDKMTEPVNFLVHLEFPHGDKPCNCTNSTEQELEEEMAGTTPKPSEEE